MSELKFDITRIVEDVVEQLESKGFTYMKRGKWVNGKCTICGKSLEDLFTGEFYYDDNEINFCPNCGADMRNDSNLQSIKCGRWEYSEKEYGECAWYFCSECDSPAEQLYTDEPLLSEFCPHCGADMRNDSNLMESEGKVLAVGLGGSIKDSLIKTEVDGLFLNFEQEEDND